MEISREIRAYENKSESYQARKDGDRVDGAGALELEELRGEEAANVPQASDGNGFVSRHT